MYHGIFKNSHYEAGFHWGQMLKKHGIEISKQHAFVISEERQKIAKGSIPIYEKYYPEILEEIKGIADGQECSYENLCTFLLSMYCFEFSNHCTCFAFKVNFKIINFYSSTNSFSIQNGCVATTANDDFIGDWDIPQPVIFEIWQKGKFSKMSKLGQVYTAVQFTY